MERTFLKTVEISCFELFLSFGLFLVDVFCISLPLNNYQRINVLNDRHFAVVDDKSKKNSAMEKNDIKTDDLKSERTKKATVWNRIFNVLLLLLLELLYLNQKALQTQQAKV